MGHSTVKIITKLSLETQYCLFMYVYTVAQKHETLFRFKQQYKVTNTQINTTIRMDKVQLNEKMCTKLKHFTTESIKVQCWPIYMVYIRQINSSYFLVNTRFKVQLN